jgi:asparagine synthase (glutamine-hydrolysing)
VVLTDLKLRLEDDLFRHSVPALLRYEDRNTMRFSVEGRVPFLTMDLLRTLWELDDSAIVGGGWNKRVLRDATRTTLPDRINRRRNKIGFTTPEDAWFARMGDALRAVFGSASFGARPYFDQRAVLDALEQMLSGRSATETMTFWRLLNVELWLRRYIDPDGGDRSWNGADQAPFRLSPLRARARRAGTGH